MEHSSNYQLSKQDICVDEVAEFIVLGCRAGSPGEGVAASGYLVRDKGKTVLLDCGPGVVLELTRHGFAHTLDAALVTHAHADHCADLVTLAYHRLFPMSQAPLPLWAGDSVARVLSGLDDIFGIPSLPVLAKPLSRAFEFHPVKGGVPFDIAGLVVEVMSTVHPVPTFAVRFPDLGLVYTADGALTDALVAFAQSAALLVAECTYVDAEGRDLNSHGHMTAAHAGQLAARAGVSQLLLTHFSTYAEAQRSAHVAAGHFRGDIQIARPGGRWKLACARA